MCDLSNEARVAVLGSHEVKGETAGAVQKAGHYTIPFVEAKVSSDWSTQYSPLIGQGAASCRLQPGGQ